MQKLQVYYAGWGEDWRLGSLADDGRAVLFEYSPEAIERGLELSPLHLRLRPAAYGDFPGSLYHLPGLMADSLPDGWGLMLMDRVFRREGIRHPRSLDRLAFIGDRAMGALRFAPPHDAQSREPDWNLLAIAQESRRVIDGDAEDALQALAIAGGSPQGARPKALVQFDEAAGTVSTRHDAPGTPWLVKFPAQGEHKEVCAIEQLYADLARECGIDIPPTHWFDLTSDMAAFAVERFDRERGMRVPVHSLAGLLHADFRAPGAVDYTALLRATRFLTRDEREVRDAFARAVFNVIFHNRDDHPKNFAWRLGSDSRWRLAPAFDLSFSEGPAGEHSLDVCGEASHITREHLLRLAADNDVPVSVSRDILDRVESIAAGFAERCKHYPIRKATVRHMTRSIAPR
jgi:serine/threonine-protein kinase HipA